jgi:hypothetical protein
MYNTDCEHFHHHVKGEIHPSWSDWLNGMEIASRGEPDGAQITILTGKIKDQAALRGLLNRLWDLNFRLIALEQIDPPAGDQDKASTRVPDEPERG